MILSPFKCSEKMSPYERESDIEFRGAEETDGTQPGGEGWGGWEASRGDVGHLTTPSKEADGSVQKGGC